MGIQYNKYLSGDKVYGCKKCQTHFALPEHIMAKSFHGQAGKAYLFSRVCNVQLGDQEERHMMTGRHIVRDLACRQCRSYVGWKYDKAWEPDQAYKEGKFILEYELIRSVQS
ncbi:protein yippee-like moh1 [Savitreella phatthalungensis]